MLCVKWVVGVLGLLTVFQPFGIPWLSHLPVRIEDDSTSEFEREFGNPKGEKQLFDIVAVEFGVGKIEVITNFAGRADQQILHDLFRPELSQGHEGVGYGDLFFGNMSGEKFVPTYALVLQSHHGDGGSCSLFSADFWLSSEDYLAPMVKTSPMLAGPPNSPPPLKAVNRFVDERGKLAGWREGFPVSLALGKYVEYPCKWSVMPKSEGNQGRITFEVDWQTLGRLYKVSVVSWTMSSAHDVIQVKMAVP